MKHRSVMGVDMDFLKGGYDTGKHMKRGTVWENWSSCDIVRGVTKKVRDGVFTYGHRKISDAKRITIYVIWVCTERLIALR